MGSDPIDLVRLVHVLISDHGVSAIDYQWGAFGQWELGTQLVVLNSQANEPHAYTGYTLPKEFYFLGQYSRFITPGALLVAVKSSDPQVKVTAFLQGPHVTVVALNDSGETRMARFDFTAPERLKLQVTRTSQTESWVRLPAVVTRHRGLSYALPALSVTTFTGTLASPLAPRLSATDSGVLQADMSASAQCRSSGTPLQRPSLGAWLGKGVNCAL